MAFDCAVLLKIVADDLPSLRRCDVARLLDLAADMGEGELLAMAAYVRLYRADLTAEVEACLADMG
jgi:hypothetical protein